jgi:hypothetical protein
LLPEGIPHKKNHLLLFVLIGLIITIVGIAGVFAYQTFMNPTPNTIPAANETPIETEPVDDTIPPYEPEPMPEEPAEPEMPMQNVLDIVEPEPVTDEMLPDEPVTENLEPQL